MRLLSLISILLALAIGAIAWQKLIDHNIQDRLPDPDGHTILLDDQHQGRNFSEECNENNPGSSACRPDVEATEQGEMEIQRRRAYGTIIKSFDDKYSRYKDRIGGRQ